eukprot:633409-Pelagomonas_calceolata.AAC.1
MQMQLPNTRLLRVMAPLQTQPLPVSTFNLKVKAILSIIPPGLPLRRLPAFMQAYQNAPTHLP